MRQQGRDADELPIVIEARHLWRQLAEECGEDIGLKQTGATYLARTDKEMAGFAKFLKIAQDHGVDTRLLDQGEVAKLIPAMARPFKGAMTTWGNRGSDAPWNRS
ncbi:FAD-dependent oxidoreductase [Mesorhizobium sp. M1399]